MIHLLNCPFCGSSASIEQIGNSWQSTIYRCDNCGCSIETGEEFNHGAEWNRRAPIEAGNGGDGRAFAIGDRVRKTKGSSWQGKVVGFYSTKLTPIGYCVESEREPGSVQIYPEGALEATPLPRREGEIMSNWITHEGGPMPVPVGTIVDFKRRCDTEAEAVWRPEEYHAEDLRWAHRGSSNDIIFYRIIRDQSSKETQS